MKTAVDFADPGALQKQNDFRHKYEIKLDFYVPKSKPLDIIFATHPAKGRQRMKTSDCRNCVALNREINQRLRESTQKTTLAIGNFLFTGLDGNVYLIWAETIRKVINKTEISIVRNEPVLILMNGYGAYVSRIFVFSDEKLIKIRDFNVYFDTTHPFYCLESDVKLNKRMEGLTVLHEAESHDRVTKQVADNLFDEGDDPLDESSDSSYESGYFADEDLVFHHSGSDDSLNDNNL